MYNEKGFSLPYTVVAIPDIGITTYQWLMVNAAVPNVAFFGITPSGVITATGNMTIWPEITLTVIKNRRKEVYVNCLCTWFDIYLLHLFVLLPLFNQHFLTVHDVQAIG